MDIDLAKRLMLSYHFISSLEDDYSRLFYFAQTGTPDKTGLPIVFDRLNEDEAYDDLISVENHSDGFTLITKQGNIRFYELRESLEVTPSNLVGAAKIWGISVISPTK